MSEKVKLALKNFNIDNEIITFNQSTKTAKQAAKALNCNVAQIVKSLIFKGKNSNKPYLILTSGINRVDESKVGEIIGESIEKADADYVKSVTGFTIGAVAPIGYKEEMCIYIDEELLKYDYVWAAAGTPNSVFKIETHTLLQITSGTLIKVN